MAKHKRRSMKKKPQGTLDVLTTEQRKTLIDYARFRGANWKAKLNRDWMRAGSDWRGGSYAFLQQIRNQHGPEWLAECPNNLYEKLREADFEMTIEREFPEGTVKLTAGIKCTAPGSPGVRYYPDGSGQPPEAPDLDIVYLIDSLGVPMTKALEDNFELSDDEYSAAIELYEEQADAELASAMGLREEDGIEVTHEGGETESIEDTIE